MEVGLWPIASHLLHRRKYTGRTLETQETDVCRETQEDGRELIDGNVLHIFK